MRIEIRRAHAEEADTLTEIAHAAKRHWNYPESWIQQWQTDLTITREFITTNEVFAATINGEIAGCCALVVTDSFAEIEHMWIRPEQMSSGVGRALFEHAKARAVERGANVIELSADPYAEGFYARMGAKRIGEIPADMDGQSRVLPRMRIDL
ncbi:MAG TPA: GNAT family N-acetyltransferase [Pyrinomonadaceae bacterium]|jgi:N-acetylglutamate synthase-like GNAT family acetyltransferase|nr:GNAT family N-acetyltransferase [Pyrinomonadaceae bacterium]